jgi:hypothetical protein
LDDAVEHSDLEIIPDLLEKARQAAGNVQEIAPNQEDVDNFYNDKYHCIIICIIICISFLIQEQ